MDHKIEVDIPAHKETRVHHTTCDICGEIIRERDGYTMDEVEVYHKSGSNYPEGGHGIEISVDMCGSCFDTRLVPWLKDLNVPIIEKEWSW